LARLGALAAADMPNGLISALVFGGLGAVMAFLVLAGFSPERKSAWESLVLSSGLAAFGVSFVLWRFFCSPDRLISTRRGGLVGVLTGLLAHPVAWYLTIVWSYAIGERSSLGDRMMNPLEGVPGCFVFALWSILLMGWLTVPAGGIAGWMLGRALRPH
jgi:hypothetical protein